MTIFEQAQKLYNYPNFRYQSFYFDHKSYDDAEDIPHVIFDGRRMNVYTTNFAFGGRALRCHVADDVVREIIIRLEVEDDKLMEIGIDRLLRDMYYETEESGEIGDFELDFLGIE